MIKRISAILLALVFVGCSNTVRTEFKTLEDAENAKAFSRGWLPPLLPHGTTNIVEENNVDVNIGQGSFEFPSRSTAPYIQALGTLHSAAITNTASGVSIVVAKPRTQWKVELDPEKGTGTYSVKGTSAEPAP